MFTESGGIEVARTPERMQELQAADHQGQGVGHPRRAPDPGGRARSWSRTWTRRSSSAAATSPPSASSTALRAGTLMRERAQAVRRAHGRCPAPRSLDIDDRRTGRTHRRRHAASGEIATGQRRDLLRRLVAPRSPRLAGARLALTPAVHQMISVGPIGLFAGHDGRDLLPDRPRRGRRACTSGSTAATWRSAPTRTGRSSCRPETIPSNEAGRALADRAAVHRRRLRPAARRRPGADAGAARRREGAGIRYAINGLISMTPDGHPLLGETPEVKGLWTAAASWIKEGPGCGRAVAELMSGKVPTVDVHEADVARFYPSSRTAGVRPRPRRRGVQQDVRHRAPRRAVRVRCAPLRTGPLYERARDTRRRLLRDRPLGAAALVRVATSRCWRSTRAGSWSARPSGSRAGGRRSSTPSTWRCATGAGLVDLSAFTILDVTGPGALAGLQHLAVAQLDVPVGQDRLHAVPQRGGRVRRRPDDHASRRDTASGWSPARRDGGAGRQVDQRPACRTDARLSRRHARRGPRSGCGDRAPATSSPRCSMTGERERPARCRSG